MPGPIQFSSAALDAFKLQAVACQTMPRAVRLGVRGGSCSGLQYVIQFDYDVARQTDIEWKDDGVTFVVDKKSVLYLTGSRLEWKSTLMKSGFEFVNPNEANRCGCGSSFSAK